MSQQKLLQIYKLYTAWTKEFDFACQKGCSTCCTQSVSMTTLEGELILDYIKTTKPELLDTLKNLPASSLNQKTTNQFAAACLREEEDEEESESWEMAPCAFLQNNCCTIYPVRSFMCRSFGSKTPCDMKGEAEIEPLFLTLNTITLQCIEHLDCGRPWGNMNTILQIAENTNSNDTNKQGGGIRISELIPGFLIPPEESVALEGQLQKLLKIIGIS